MKKKKRIFKGLLKKEQVKTNQSTYTGAKEHNVPKNKSAKEFKHTVKP